MTEAVELLDVENEHQDAKKQIKRFYEYYSKTTSILDWEITKENITQIEKDLEKSKMFFSNLVRIDINNFIHETKEKIKNQI